MDLHYQDKKERFNLAMAYNQSRHFEIELCFGTHIRIGIGIGIGMGLGFGSKSAMAMARARARAIAVRFVGLSFSFFAGNECRFKAPPPNQ